MDSRREQCALCMAVCLPPSCLCIASAAFARGLGWQQAEASRLGLLAWLAHGQRTWAA